MENMDIRTILTFFSTIAIVSGTIFAGFQFRQFKRQRSREMAMQMMNYFRSPEFLNAVNIVFDLPEGLSRKEIEDRLGEKLVSVLVMFGTVESLGILIFRREVDIELVEDFISGIIILSGRKFERYLDNVRTTSNRHTYYEWFTWLHNQCEKREKRSPAVPAYIAYKDWEA